MSYFGNNSPGSATASLSNYIVGGHYAPSQNGYVIDIQMYAQNLDTNPHNLFAALYVYLGPGNPGPVISYTNSTVIPANTTEALFLCPFPSNVPVSAGTQYFIMAETDDQSGLVYLWYNPGGAAGIDAYYTPISTPPYWPDLTGLCTSSTAERCIFADYIPSVPSVPQVYGDGLTSYTC
jgi:hypothetical protein